MRSRMPTLARRCGFSGYGSRVRAQPGQAGDGQPCQNRPQSQEHPGKIAGVQPDCRDGHLPRADPGGSRVARRVRARRRRTISVPAPAARLNPARISPSEATRGKASGPPHPRPPGSPGFAAIPGPGEHPGRQGWSPAGSRKAHAMAGRIKGQVTAHQVRKEPAPARRDAASRSGFSPSSDQTMVITTRATPWTRALQTHANHGQPRSENESESPSTPRRKIGRRDHRRPHDQKGEQRTPPEPPSSQHVSGWHSDEQRNRTPQVRPRTGCSRGLSRRADRIRSGQAGKPRSGRENQAVVRCRGRQRRPGLPAGPGEPAPAPRLRPHSSLESTSVNPCKKLSRRSKIRVILSGGPRFWPVARIRASGASRRKRP